MIARVVAIPCLIVLALLGTSAEVLAHHTEAHCEQQVGTWEVEDGGGRESSFAYCQPADETVPDDSAPAVPISEIQAVVTSEGGA